MESSWSSMGHENPKDLLKKLNNCNASSSTTCIKSSSLVLTKFLFFNARSLVNKTKLLDVLLKQEDFDFLFIVETWLKPVYTDGFIVDTNNFSVLRCDRLQDRGGGVCAIFKNSLSSQVSPIDIDSSLIQGFEIVAFDFFLNNHISNRFICVYLPPSSASNIVITQNLVRCLRKLTTSSDFYLVGDFNFSQVNWKNISLSVYKQSFLVFKDYLDSFNLTQLISFPTHTHGNTLDLLITSKPQNILKLKCREPFSDTCDHNMISFTINLKNVKFYKSPPKRNFYRCNFEEINSYLAESDLNTISQSTDVNTAFSLFIDKIHTSIDKFVPFSKPTRRPRLPNSLKLLLNLKKQLYRRIKFDPISKSLYKDIAKCYKKSAFQFYSDMELNVVTSASKKYFFSYINRKLKSKSNIPPLQENNGLVTDPYEKSNILNSQFASVFKIDNQAKPYLDPLPINFPNSSDIKVTAAQTHRAIMKLKSSVSSTPDQVPALFIKKICSVISTPLTYIFNLSLDQGKVPGLWKKALVTPIHKKGMRSNPANYRPISLTSVFCRVLESIIHDLITNYLFENSLISSVQYGFIKFRSTQTQHIDLLNQITSNFEKKISSTVVYLDFSKAFDSVPHSKLIYILNHFKINAQLVNWITDYLSDRTQQTMIEGCLSQPCQITSGVPQGSVLGPLLFVIYLDDLIKQLTKLDDVYTFAFADDLKILSSNYNSLQKSLDLVNHCSASWQLKIQPTKSEQIFFSSRSTSTQPTFYINNSVIPKVGIVKDLGVLISDNLKWNPHIQKVVSKSLGSVFLILKSFISYNPVFYVNLYKLYVRPNLEYNVCTWMPSQVGDIKKIESVQIRFTKFLCRKLNIRYQSYLHRLEILKLQTLEIRRVKQDMILVYKMLNNLVDLDFRKYFTINHNLNRYNLRRHTLYLKLPIFASSSTRHNFFSYRAVKTWNQLPNEVVTASSLSSFKTKLSNFNLYSIYPSKL